MSTNYMVVIYHFISNNEPRRALSSSLRQMTNTFTAMLSTCSYIPTPEVRQEGASGVHRAGLRLHTMHIHILHTHLSIQKQQTETGHHGVAARHCGADFV